LFIPENARRAAPSSFSSISSTGKKYTEQREGLLHTRLKKKKPRKLAGVVARL
jgi:hypothetical protein